MKKDEAIAAGAIAFFGEKYGDKVRVVSVGDFSVELCGGTHVDNSSEIHLFKIGTESGIAAGVRRIIAYTSKGAFDYLSGRHAQVTQLRDLLKSNTAEEVVGRVERMLQTERELRKQIEQFQAKSASSEVDEMLAKARTVGAAKLVTGLCAPDAEGIKRLRDIADRIKQKEPTAVVVLGMKDPGSEKANLLVAVGPQGPKSVSASDLLKEIAPLIEGRGGGKPDLAQAGGTKAAGLTEALQRAENWLKGKA
jgi:alanyl-tRNA synthetase